MIRTTLYYVGLSIASALSVLGCVALAIVFSGNRHGLPLDLGRLGVGCVILGAGSLVTLRKCRVG
jgi:hypothetical protein